LLKAYKAHNPIIPWQCGTLNTPPHVWHYCPNTCTTGGKAQYCPRPWSSDTMIKFIEPYSSTKGTLREEVCSKLIKPTTQVYLSNVGLLTEKRWVMRSNDRQVVPYPALSYVMHLNSTSYCMLLFSILISFPWFDRRIHVVSLVWKL
jgi:hypothetical protein